MTGTVVKKWYKN